jgi:hypothetical protein
MQRSIDLATYRNRQPDQPSSGAEFNYLFAREIIFMLPEHIFAQDHASWP